MQKKREMKITRNNYETFFLDYLEGNLDENLVDDFLEFLRENPDLKEELSMMNTAPVVPKSAALANKEKLYKEKYDAEEIFNEAAVALIEGDLSATEKAEFDAYLLKHPEKQREVQRFQQTRLQPDESLVFDHKNRLYRRTPGRTVFLWSSRVAAVLVLALTIYFFIDRDREDILDQNQVAVADTGTTGEKLVPEAQQPAIDIVEKETDSKNSIPNKKIAEHVNAEVPPVPPQNVAETNPGRMDYKQIADARIPVEVPEKISSIDASLQTRQSEHVALVNMTIILSENEMQYNDEKFFADVVKEKTGLDNLSLQKIAKAGLNLVSNISKDNFSYQTNHEGEITELNYDSRLLAFSIPTNNEPVVGE